MVAMFIATDLRNCLFDRGVPRWGFLRQRGSFPEVLRQRGPNGVQGSPYPLCLTFKLVSFEACQTLMSSPNSLSTQGNVAPDFSKYRGGHSRNSPKYLGDFEFRGPGASTEAPGPRPKSS